MICKVQNSGYNTINTIRKDTNPKTTIKNIKKILKENNYKVKEKHIRKNLNGLYSLRLELNNRKGANGKGITLNYAKASAYAELIERLQSNMLTKKRINTNTTNRDPEFCSWKVKKSLFFIENRLFFSLGL